MDGDAATGRVGRAAGVAGTDVSVFMAAGTVGVAVAGMGVTVSVTTGAGGKVAMVGMDGETVLQATMASRTASPPRRILIRRERIMTPLWY
jgi:FtsP/CotA-like multicopper oxidase with cupredoxin domain